MHHLPPRLRAFPQRPCSCSRVPYLHASSLPLAMKHPPVIQTHPRMQRAHTWPTCIRVPTVAYAQGQALCREGAGDASCNMHTHGAHIADSMLLGNMWPDSITPAVQCAAPSRRAARLSAHPWVDAALAPPQQGCTPGQIFRSHAPQTQACNTIFCYQFSLVCQSCTAMRRVTCSCVQPLRCGSQL